MTGPDATAPPPRQHPSGGRHLLRALIVVASAVALILLASLGVLTYLRTPAGTARLLRFGAEAANGAIAGRVDAESATLQGSHLVLHRVTLTDPEGERVAFVEEVQAELVLRAPPS